MPILTDEKTEGQRGKVISRTQVGPGLLTPYLELSPPQHHRAYLGILGGTAQKLKFYFNQIIWPT